MLAKASSRLGRGVLNGGLIRRLQRLSQPEATFVRWAMCALARWRPSAASRRVPVFQIHGALDRTLPVALTRPDVIVPTGGHALTLFSAEAVNTFLMNALERVAPRSDCGTLPRHASTSFTTLP